MVLGDGVRRNIASVDPFERELLRDAFIELNKKKFPGIRTDIPVPGGVTYWFKQDEIHQATHVHKGPEFLPWHREIVNRVEQMLREINPQLSLHYWDWTQDPRNISDANLGGGIIGTLNLFTSEFMGNGPSIPLPIGEPWESAKFYDNQTTLDRDSTNNPADPPNLVERSVEGVPSPVEGDIRILGENDYAAMRRSLEEVHDSMHGFVAMGGPHISFRDPFVFLLHSNVDRIFARWQTDPVHPQRLNPDTVYEPESNENVPVASSVQNLNNKVEPWSTGLSVDQFGNNHSTRPWCAPENEGVPFTYKDPSIVAPPLYDTNLSRAFVARFHEGDPGTGIGGYDLHSTADRAFAFDYDSSGKMDHLVLYRPGTGTIWIVRKNPTTGIFSSVYAQGDPGTGIGGYDLHSTADRAFAFDYDRLGKRNFLVLYRPNTGTIWIM